MAARSNGLKPGWVRLALALLVLLIGVLAARHGLGLALSGSRPALALRIDAENAFPRAQSALALVEGHSDAASRAKAREMARGTLRRDAGNVIALAALGLATDGPAQAGAIFTAAESLSRRNLITQLWMIEHAVSRNDVAGALHHYDIALRTSRSAPSILFPVLVEATTDDALLPEIARTLAQRPLWGGLYLQQLAQSGSDRHRIAVLFATLKRRGIPTGAAADAALYARLLEAQLFDDAWSLYAAEHGSAPRDGVRGSLFSEQPEVATPFDWQVNDGDSVSARIEQVSAGKGELVFTTAAGEGGEVAKQTLVLTPGNYTVQVDAEGIETADAQPPYVTLACLPAGTELLRKPIGPRDGSTATFTVPANCRAQTLSLVAQAASGLGTVSGTVRAVRLSRER
jgi:hypothetical protein